MNPFILPFEKLSLKNLADVGGKNASLGEMIQNLRDKGIEVPGGFAVTVAAFDNFLLKNSLNLRLKSILDSLDANTLDNLEIVGEQCRNLIKNGSLSVEIKNAVTESYSEMEAAYGKQLSFAIRSSATAEDSPGASFAGQHESFLHISGIENVLDALLKCYTSLYNNRAIKYRLDNGFKHEDVKLSVAVQLMVRSDLACAGVAFTIEPENGNRNLIYITGAYGLGESVVQGAVNTDEFYLFKPAIEYDKNPIVSRILGTKERMLTYESESGAATGWKNTTREMQDVFILSDEEIELLGKWCLIIEKHYGTPMDIEWAKDGISGKLYIVQARPETVFSKNRRVSISEFKIDTNDSPLVSGKAVGKNIVSGEARLINSLADAHKIKEGDVIVADITNPDWNALLRKAKSIVTNQGGRTSHASIVARELGIPAVVGTGDATEKIADGQWITVSCASGDEGHVYNGKINFEEKSVFFDEIPQTKTKPMLILADPQKALLYATYPNEGVGLLRMEFIINNTLQVHPMALINYDSLTDEDEKAQIAKLIRKYKDKKQFFVDKLAEAIGLVAAAFYPKPVIVRMSDFKTNEYAKLLGGKSFEPTEENPMIGFRGASRYYNEKYKAGFGLECAAIIKVHNEMALRNVKVMIPFCRTVEEGKKVLETMETFGLKRGKDGLEVYVMAEIPSNILLADQFAQIFDGFSIGSNDLTQLTLGIDRDSAMLNDLFDENNKAVKMQISNLIRIAKEMNVAVGLCGQAPSDYPAFAGFLVGAGIDSISFTPDALLTGIKNIASAESTTNSAS